VKRLHAGARFSEVEEWVGDPIRGRGLFKEQGRLQCSRCHQVGNEGGRIGPSFDSIGRRLTKSQLFESIAEPSRLIDPKYQTHLVMTNDGEVITGLLESESQKELVIITSTGEKRTISIDEISQRKLETQSLMPAGLLEQLTAQEMADLLAYLSSLSSVVE
jgi:quinoprotein glucose dehydrogenase